MKDTDCEVLGMTKRTIDNNLEEFVAAVNTRFARYRL